jgi:LPS-assembly protein
VPDGVSISDYAFQLAMAQSSQTAIAASDVAIEAAAVQNSTPTIDLERQVVTVATDGLINGATYIEADSIATDKDGSIIAKGRVQMRNRARLIRADEIRYNSDTSEIVAIGNTQTINDDGSVQFADSIAYNNEVDQGVGENIASTGKDNTKILARRIERLDEDTNRLLNVRKRVLHNRRVGRFPPKKLPNAKTKNWSISTMQS